MEKLMDEGITKIYCGHYPYVKMAYDKAYITEMRMLAESLHNGTAPKATHVLFQRVLNDWELPT